MDREKINKAAKQDAIHTVIGDLYERGNYEMGFVAGADWLMQQPLSDRLTNEEKEKLTPANRYLLRQIFGSDLFKEK